MERAKFVERNGELWMIAEADLPSYGCFIAVLSLRMFQWRRARVEVRDAIEDLVMDVTRDGTVIMLKRRWDATYGTTVESFSTFSSGQVTSLERCAFLALLQNRPGIRHLPTSDLVSMGVPKKYID